MSNPESFQRQHDFANAHIDLGNEIEIARADVELHVHTDEHIVNASQQDISGTIHLDGAFAARQHASHFLWGDTKPRKPRPIPMTVVTEDETVEFPDALFPGIHDYGPHTLNSIDFVASGATIEGDEYTILYGTQDEDNE